MKNRHHISGSQKLGFCRLSCQVVAQSNELVIFFGYMTEPKPLNSVSTHVIFDDTSHEGTLYAHAYLTIVIAHLMAMHQVVAHLHSSRCRKKMDRVHSIRTIIAYTMDQNMPRL